MERIWRVLTRKKAIDPVNAEETRLNRILNTFDLTALGIGSTLGVGVYVLAGQVAKDTAGPSVILSFFIAAVTSVFAGLCYAEFGARAPRAGSAYIYSYVCVGEFIAFVIGWNLILEYVIGAASVARGLSLYLDTLVNGTIQDTFRHIAPINVEYMSEYFDFLSFGLSILLAVALAFGMKESSMGNNIVTVLNIFIVLFIIVAGSLKADISNWNVSPNSTNTTANIGNGGFFPFGIEGMIKGAATCFYGFVGFDCIATTGEEVMNPRKAIPVSIIVSLFIIFCAYFGTATVLTLMVPYYLQDHDAPIPRAFEMVGWDWAKWVVAIGALCGLCASLFGAMFPLPRVIYAMGSDGLVFKFLAKVHPKFQTPVIGTIFAGILTGLMSALFNLNQLVNMMSIGTLLAYTIVAASVLLLRYKEDVKKVYTAVRVSSDTESTNSESSDVEKYDDDVIRQNFDGPSTSDETELINNEQAGCCNSLFYIFNYKSKEPSKITENIVAVEVFLFCILCVCIGLCVIYLKSPIIKGEIWAIAISSVVVGITVLLIISISTQPTSKKELSFKVPLVPLIPALSILVNIYLMLMLDSMTWIRFAVWMAIGTPMYLLCACSNEPHTTHTKGTYFSANITNGQPTSLNGFSNPSFEIEQGDSSTIKSPTKKKKMAPTPPDLKRVQSVDVQPDTVIAQLDQVLEKVTLSEWEEDGLSDETSRISSRKLSAGSVSNLSVVVSNRENVIADVHHADLAPIPNLKSPSVHDIPTIEKCDSEIVEVCEEVLPLTKANDKNEHQNFTPLQEYSIELEHGDENLPVALNNDATSNKIAQMQNPNESTFSKFNEDDRDKKSGNQDKNNEEINKSNEGISKISMNEIRHDTFQGHVQDVTKIEDKILEGSDENNFDILDQNITKTDKESSILNEEFLKITVDKNIETGGNQNYIDIGNKPNDYESSKSNELITKKPLHKNPPDIDNDNNINSSLATQFIDNTSNHPPAVPSQKPDNASNFKVETQTTPITPTEEALKSVTLRHVKSVIKNIIPTLNQNASDSNLKAGSDQYKFFSENLNNKLKVRPRVAFFPVIQTHVVTVPKEVKFKHNEDVIEEQIDREGAKVKLQEFLKNDSARNFMNESTKYNDIKNGSSENVDNSFIKKSEEDPDTGLKNRDESGLNHKDESELKDADDSGFMEHQNKMKKVFSSMKLKNSNNEVQTRRLSKSLGSSFIKEDHHGAHRQKMGDIFKSIHALKTED